MRYRTYPATPLVLVLALLAVVICVTKLGGLDLLGSARAEGGGGPIAAYSFDEGEGTTVDDLSGNGHTATIIGAQWTTKGRFGGAMQFDVAHEEDVLKVPDANDLDLTGDFTLEAWVRPISVRAWATVIGKEDAEESSFSYLLYSQAESGGPGVELRKGSTTTEEFAEEELPIEAWSHIALTSDRKKARLYVDGVLVKTSKSFALPSTNGALTIGGNGIWGEYFDGRIDEVRIYDRVLSEAEVQTDEVTTLQTPAAGPLVEFSFDEAEGEQVADLSGNGHDATIEGAERSEGKYGGSLKFDGESMLSVPASEELDLTEEFTLEAWIKPEPGCEFGQIFVKEDAAEEQSAYVFAKHGSRLAAYLGVPGVEAESSYGTLRNGVWQYIALTYNGAHVRLYVNGHLVESVPAIDVISTDGILRIGGSNIWGPGDDFAGKIDQVRVYGRALFEAEIAADKSPREGPVAAYTLNENEGTSVQDISGDGHTGAIEGAEWTEGKYGRGLKFDGEAEDVLSIPASEELDLTDEFTLEAWIRPENESEFGHLFVKEDAAEEDAAYVVTDHHSQLGVYLGEPEVKSWSLEGSLALNAWIHIAVTDDGYDVRTYLNGELVETAEASPVAGTNGKLRIGGSQIWGPESNFNGKIDEARIFDRALSEAQIVADMRNDFTPPEIELSGALTEGLKEGTTKYPLHVDATDGKAGFPGVGVKSIAISIDGKVADSISQECSEGSCPLEREWTFDSETYGFKPHAIGISVEDQAGNVASRPLDLAVPNGSIPACSPTGEEVPSPPDEEVELSGGGVDAIYHGSEGEKIEFRSAPPGFNPKKATAEELDRYGYPPRPPATEPALREVWDETVGEATGSAEPGGCMGVSETEFDSASAGAGPSPTIRYSEGFAGWTAEDPSGPAKQWQGAVSSYNVPKLRKTCSPYAALVSWVGVGGSTVSSPFFQAGTNEPYAIAEGSEVAAFTEFFRGGPGKGTRPEEQPNYHNLDLGSGDPVYVAAEWKPGREAAYMFVQNRVTKQKLSVEVHGKEGDLYDGRRLQYITAERPEVNHRRFEQQDFGTFGFKGVGGILSGGKMEPLGALEHRVKIVMQRAKNNHPNGQLMVSTSPISKSGTTFQASWHHCHP